jgi:putative ATPase
LTTLEVADGIASSRKLSFDAELVALATQHGAIRYDATGDQHYQIVSALIKSLRASDPDAGLYWLARMLAGGEDLEFICRRLVIFASEDVSNADPAALGIAVNATRAARFVGYPEAQLTLAQAVTYLALAPKSNRSMEALGAAKLAVEEHGPLPVPAHLVNAPTPLMKALGFGAGYDYPHDHDDAIGRQDYLPEPLLNAEFYRPSDRGREAELSKRLAALRALRRR